MKLEETFCNPQYDWFGKGSSVAKPLGEKLYRTWYALKFQNVISVINVKVGGKYFYN